ncbi:MAG: OmpA family protein [Bacteroidota bacterium]
MNDLRTVALLLLLPVLALSQSRETKIAFEVYDNMEYSKSLNLLEKAFIKEKDQRFKAEIVYRLGESNRNMAKYSDAIIQYERAIKLDYGPEAGFKYGKMLQMLGRYDEAEEAFKEYLEESPSDDRVNKLLRSISLAKKLESEKTDYKLRNIIELNSEFNDFSPTFYGKPGSENVLVYTSTRLSENSMKEDAWLGTGFSNLYQSNLERKGNDVLGEKSKWSHAVGFSESINTVMHEGAACFTKNKDEMFFTRCDYSEDEESGCGIFYSKLVNGIWSEPVEIVKSEGGTVAGHPAISPDGKTLVFSSDGPNSIGENDLYYVKKSNSGEWSERPKTLGRRINTIGNEMYPWIDEKGNLYFASDGHEGLGGLDVFMSKLGTKTWGGPQNLKIPINSQADDFGLIFNADKTIGYVSSNRNGSVGMDDLYEVRLLPFLYTLKGSVIDANTGRKLSGVQIKLEGNDGSVNFSTSNNDGEYEFGTKIMRGDVSYKLVLRLKKYLAQVASFSTLGIPVEEFEPVEGAYLSNSRLNLEMDHISDPIVLPHIEYDFNSAKLRPEATESLKLLVDVLEENPDIVINLRAHTDHIGKHDYNMKLSQARAQSCVDFLVSKGIDNVRLKAEGMGETDPFTIPENFESSFDHGTILTEDFIKHLDDKKESEARQYNRRTDFKVLGEIVKRDIVTDPLNDTVAVIDQTMEIDTVSVEIPIEEEEVVEKVIVEYYDLEQGDNYGTVANKFNISVKELKALNEGLRATRPFVGMKLKVNLNTDYSEFDSKHYRIQRAENTFEKLLLKTGLSEDEFFDLNPDFIEDDLKPGYLVVVK